MGQGGERLAKRLVLARTRRSSHEEDVVDDREGTRRGEPAQKLSMDGTGPWPWP